MDSRSAQNQASAIIKLSLATYLASKHEEIKNFSLGDNADFGNRDWVWNIWK